MRAARRDIFPVHRNSQRIDIVTISLLPLVVEIRCGCGHFKAEAGDQLSAIEKWNDHANEAGHPDGWAVYVDA